MVRSITTGCVLMVSPSSTEVRTRHPGIIATAVLIMFILSSATSVLCVGGSADADGSAVIENGRYPETITVNTWSELRDALENCGGVTIILGCDIILDDDSDEPEIEDRSLEIDLNRHMINGNGHSGRFFHVGDYCILDVKNGSLISGRDDDGGCAYIEKMGTLRFSDVAVAECGCDDDGGAIFVNGGDFEMYGGSISNCRSDDNAGAIYANGDG